MAKRGRKKKVWVNDFKTQQQILLDKHASGAELTQEEVCYLVGKDGKMPTCREEMVTKMTICKWEAAALLKLRKTICKMFPNWTENQVKDAMLSMLDKRTYAKETGIPEKLDYSYAT